MTPQADVPLRIYIDTSVLAGCFDREFATWSNGLIRDFRAGRLTPVLSDVTSAEVEDAPEAVRHLQSGASDVVEDVLPITEETLLLVAAYEARKICRPGTSQTCGILLWQRLPRSRRS